MRAMGRGIRSLWRSRVAWVVLTAVVVGDTWWWSRDYPPAPAGVFPEALFNVLGRASARVSYYPDLFVYAMPVDTSGRRPFVDDYARGTDEPWMEAEYVVIGQIRSYCKGLWAPCVRYERAWVTGFNEDDASTAPPAVALEALAWYEQQPSASEAEAQERQRVVSRLRSGATTSIVLWPGVLHDGLMSLLTLLWLVLTGAHVSRFTLRHTRDARRRRRREAGLCERCGYPLIGQAFSRCPECGAELEN